jgi:cullin 3
MGGSGVPTMIKVGDVNGLGRVFNALSKVAEGPQAMAACLSAYLQECGSKIVQEPEGPLTSHGAFAITYVQRLIELKALVDRFMKLSFGDSVFLKRAANADFEQFINANQRSPEYLSLFIDDRLRKCDQVVCARFCLRISRLIFYFLRWKLSRRKWTWPRRWFCFAF